MSPGARRGRLDRVLRFLHLRRGPKPPERAADEPPPDAGVREPRRPKPLAPGGAAVLERPDTDVEDVA